MSEGKLKKQIDVLVEPYEQVYFNVVDENPFTKDAVFDILDEAKANFPNQKNKKYETISEASGFDWLLYEADIDVWFKKYFGEVKKT